MTTQDHPAYIHANEAIVPLDKYPGMKSLLAGGSGGGAINIPITINVTEGTKPEVVAKMAYDKVLVGMRQSKAMRDAVSAGQGGSLNR